MAEENISSTLLHSIYVTVGKSFFFFFDDTVTLHGKTVLFN